MVVLTRPTPTALFGAQNWVFVPTIAAIASPTVAEITATGSLDITAILFTSSATPTQSTNQVTRVQRIADTISYQFPGLTNYTLGDLRYAFNQQGGTGTPERKLWVTFGAGAGVSGFLVWRSGLVNTTAFIAAQKVTVFPISVGPGLPTIEGDAEAAEGAVVQTVTITGPVALDAAVS